MTATKKAIALLFLFTITIYSNSLGGEFLFDDEYFVVKNVAIRNPESILPFFTNPSAAAFSELSQDVYRPITTVSYAIDYFIWKLNTFGYHLVNVLFHSFNVILVFLLLYTAFGDIFLAFVAAMLFASHPVQTEAVSWISGRSSVLFLFFYLISLLLYILYTKKGSGISRRPYLALSLIAYAASLFSKEMAVSLPLILIAYDAHFNNDKPFWKRFYSRYSGYFVLAAVFVLARSAVLQRVSQCDWWGGSPYHNLLTMLQLPAEYLKIMLFPVNLCAFYAANIYTSIADTGVIISLVTIAFIVIAMAFAFNRTRGASFAMWWFLITLLPVSNIVPLRAVMAERFLYLPSIGFCLLAAIFIERIGLVGFKRKLKYPRMVALFLAAALVVSYSLRTMARNEDWKNAFSLSNSILKTAPLNPWALAALGEAYSSQGRHEEAIKPLKKAIAVTGAYFSPMNILGFSYVEMGRYDEAISVLKDALKIKPDNLEALNSLGVAYASVNRHEEAIKQFERSIGIDKTFINAYLNIGTTYDRMGRYDKALEEYGKVELNTNSKQDIAIAYIRMGDVYIKMRLPDKAKEFYAKAAGLCGRGMDQLKQVAMDRLSAKWDLK